MVVSRLVSWVSVPVVFGVLLSLSTLACSGGGSSGSGDGGAGGLGSGATATPTSACNATGQWATRCGFTVDQAKCVQEGAAYNASQLQAATDCASQKSCDKTLFDQCFDKALSSNGGGSADGGAGTKSDGGASASTCDSCARASCASEVAACESLPACVSLFNCVEQAAGDKVKVQACVDQDPTGLATLQSLARCENEKCPTQCQ